MYQTPVRSYTYVPSTADFIFSKFFLIRHTRDRYKNYTRNALIIESIVKICYVLGTERVLVYAAAYAFINDTYSYKIHLCSYIRW